MAACDFVKGYDHIGIPTADMEKTIAFYTALGFTSRFETYNNGKVIFFGCGDVIVETYENLEQAAGRAGAINHIALEVSDLDKTLEEVKKTGYEIVEGPNFLQYWENGVRYFTIAGPNMERVEFSQKL